MAAEWAVWSAKRDKPSAVVSETPRGYYVDASLGDDTGLGTEADPWETAAKVNGYNGFNPGDKVFFKCGETWNEELYPHNDLYYNYYGTGIPPTFDGEGVRNCITVSGKSNINLHGFRAINGINYNVLVGFGSNGIQILNFYGRNAGNDGLIFIQGAYNCVADGGVWEDSYRPSGTTYNASGIEVADGCHDILLKNQLCLGNETSGITVHSHNLTGTNYVYPYNVTIMDVTCSGSLRSINIERMDQNELTPPPHIILAGEINLDKPITYAGDWETLTIIDET